MRELGLFLAVSPFLPFRSSGSPLLLRARDSAVRRRNDGVSAPRCRMCISVMCVEVGRAAGLIRSSQLFPPSLSSRSLEYCAVRSVRLSHNPFITSIAITETSFLSPSHPKRRPHATILERSPVCVAFGFFAVPSHAGSIPLSNHTSLHPRASYRTVNPPSGSLC